MLQFSFFCISTLSMIVTLNQFMLDQIHWFTCVTYVNLVVKSHEKNVDSPFHLQKRPRLINIQRYEVKGMFAADPAARRIVRQMDSFCLTGSNDRNNVIVNKRLLPGR